MKEPFLLELFNKLYTNYHSRFRHFAYSYVKDTYIAEDIVNEAFMVYWEGKNSLKPDSNVPAYILTIVKNKCLNHLKQKETQHKILSDIQDHTSWELSASILTLEACNPEELFSDEIKKIVNNTLKFLPEKTRNVFIMSRYKSKSHKEIAEILNITTKGVEFHITKALLVFRQNLKDYLLSLLILLYIHFFL